MKQLVVELCRSVQAETENSFTPVWFFWRAKEKPVVSLKEYESSLCLNACYMKRKSTWLSFVCVCVSSFLVRSATTLMNVTTARMAGAQFIPPA